MFFMMVRYVYSLIFSLLMPFVIFRLLWRSLKGPRYRRRLLERFGIFKAPSQQGGLWVHAVSVGEARAAVILIKAFKECFPELAITVTTTPPTGSEQVQKLLKGLVHHVYLPYDLPWTLAPFFYRIKPRLAVIMETELWPNLLTACHKRGIPVGIVNGRLSDDSIRGYLKLGKIMPILLKNVTFVAAQSKLDADRFVALGLEQHKLYTTGNIKFDLECNTHKKFGEELKNSFGNRKVWGCCKYP